MINGLSIRREILVLLIGAAIGVLFGVLVAYPEMLANSRENRARIESNEKQIEQLWDAHEISHKTPESGGEASE